jgi:ABC-type amino acid transport/signal transduction systems, periplasmic component/domain
LLPASISEAGVLKVGSNFQEPPWGSYAADGTTPVGLDVDLMTAITQVLGLKVAWTNMAWDGLRPALQTHRFDAVAADMYDYTDRQAQVTFVDYVSDGAAAAVKSADAANVTSIESLAGKTVGVAKGTSAEIQSGKLNTELTAKGLKPMDISVFADDQAVFLALRAGRIYAYIGEVATLNYQCKNAGNGTLFTPVLPGLISGVMCGVVVNKDDMALAKAIQAALNQLMQDGTYGTILAKYGMTAGALKEATINGSTISSTAI